MDAYIGYINLFFIACALSRRSLWRRLGPWLLAFLAFAVLSLGSHLTVNGIVYESVILPRQILMEWIPAVFGQIGLAKYYVGGVVVPLAVLACFGFSALLRGRRWKTRVFAVLLASLVIAVEYYAPHRGAPLATETMRYLGWLRAEDDAPVKVVNLPQRYNHALHYLFLQSESGYPSAYGFVNRNRQSALGYVNNNELLRKWYRNRAMHCLPHTQAAFIASLEGLLADGFTHVVVHNWLWREQPTLHGVRNAPAAYDDGYVAVYRLRDMSQSCQHQLDLPQLSRFTRSPLALPGARSSILSFHSSEGLDPNELAYLGSLFADWERFVHVTLQGGELAIQNSGAPYASLDEFTSGSQIVYLIYDSRDAEAALADRLVSSEQFQRCQRERHEDGSVIELQVSREFSCALVNSGTPLRVEYDNGARLENVIAEAGQEHLKVQYWWSELPSEAHSVSIQIVDAAGEKVASRDAVIEHGSLARQRVDIASLAPGDYQVKLIVYDYHSLRSVAGHAAGLRFERELPIMTFERG